MAAPYSASPTISTRAALGVAAHETASLLSLRLCDALPTEEGTGVETMIPPDDRISVTNIIGFLGSSKM